jgi:RHS repeat-associated protein
VPGPWSFIFLPYVDAQGPGATFHSLNDVATWYETSFTPRAGWCSSSLTSITPGSNGNWPTEYDYYNIPSLPVYLSWTLNFSVIGYAGSCNEMWSAGSYALQTRTFACLSKQTPVLSNGVPICPLVNPFKPLDCCTATAPDTSPSSNTQAADVGSSHKTAGNPVDVSNGNKYETETDYVGPTVDALRFVRSYNSLLGASISQNTGGTVGYMTPWLGNGWTASYFQSLTYVSVPSGTQTFQAVYAFRPDGRTLVFYYTNGSYAPDADTNDTLMQTASGWEYQTPDDTIETYNSAGLLVSVARRGQYPVTVNYEASAGAGEPPLSVSDAFGHTLTFKYGLDSIGVQRLVSVTDPSGALIQYAYDGSGDLASVTYQDSTTHTYGYTQGNSLLTTLTDEANVAYASWSYNGSYQPISSQHAGGVNAYSFSYNLPGSGGGTTGTSVVTDPLNQQYTYSQQLIEGVFRVTGVTPACPTCGDDNTRVFDPNGNVTSRTDFNNNKTTYVYNTATNLETSRTEASGTAVARTITTTWDPSWREPDSVTEPNRTTSWKYDGMGNILTKTVTDTTVTPNVARTWTYTYDSYGRVKTADGPRTDVSDVTTYAYYTCTTGHQCGQLETITDALGHVTTFNTYNAHGQPLTITDPNGVVTTLTYDARLRLTSREVGTENTGYSYYPTGLLETVTMPDGSTVKYGYDPAHRLTDITDTLGNHIHYTLDNMDNRTAENVYDPSGTLRRTHTRVFNALNQLYQDVNAAGTAAVTTTLTYDAQGNLKTSDAPLNRNTTNYYDALNRLDQVTAPINEQSYYGYDANDNLASVKDPRALTTTYTHDGFGDVTQLQSPDTATTRNTFDSAGNLKTSTDARSAQVTYSLDALNRITQQAYVDQTITFGYDNAATGANGIGRLTSAADANHALSWTYDGLGRITGKGQTVASITKSVGYAYTNGDLSTLVTPSGQRVAYSYTNHQITGITVNGTSLLSGVTYFPYGAVSAWTWGNGTAVARTYDQDGKISVITTAADTLNFGYDNAFRITSITDTGTSANTWAYKTYDLLDRLEGGSESGTSDGWSYDANGNRLTQTGTKAITLTPSTTSNQLNTTIGGLSRAYAYDAAGNTKSYGTLAFTFNDRGRMSAATNGSTAASYIYNALGQLIEKTVAGTTTLLMYDENGHILGEYTSAGALIQETIWMGDVPVATLRPNGSTACTTTSVCVFYVHTDQLNAPRKITNPSTNAIVWRWDTDPFGTVAANQNPTGLGAFIFNLRFPGQYYQAETGLNYNYSRDYDPQTGRYVESDPIGLQGGINTYGYAFGNPIGRADPTGLSPSSIVLQLFYKNKSGSNGSSCPNNDEKNRCRQVKNDAIQSCSDSTLPTRDHGVSFQRCVNQYIEDQGCGPGGTPLPQSSPVLPAPPVPETPDNQSTNAAQLFFLALLGLFGGALASP